jgi:hypothetical protein
VIFLLRRRLKDLISELRAFAAFLIDGYVVVMLVSISVISTSIPGTAGWVLLVPTSLKEAIASSECFYRKKDY